MVAAEHGTPGEWRVKSDPHDAVASQAAHETAHFEHAEGRQDLGRRQAAAGHDMMDRRRFGRDRGQHLGTGHLGSGAKFISRDGRPEP